MTLKKKLKKKGVIQFWERLEAILCLSSLFTFLPQYSIMCPQQWQQNCLVYLGVRTILALSITHVSFFLLNYSHIITPLLIRRRLPFFFFSFRHTYTSTCSLWIRKEIKGPKREINKRKNKINNMLLKWIKKKTYCKKKLQWKE